MDVDRWRRIKEVFAIVSQREESERPSFLEQTCGGDENLRAEVESLLVYEKGSDDLIELPALRVAADLLAEEESSLDHPPDAHPWDALIGRPFPITAFLREREPVEWVSFTKPKMST